MTGRSSWSSAAEKAATAPPGHKRFAPLSYAQQRLWFLAQLEPESCAYNSVIAVRLTGGLKVSALERSLSEIVRRHETLRTSFAMMGGRALQVVSPAQPLAVERADLAALGTAERDSEVQRRISAAAARPFDLSRAPLLRVMLLRLEADEHVLVLTTHHIAFDGWSAGIFFHELKALYQAFSAGLASPLPELSFQYRDFAVWQRQWLAESVLQQQLAYWKRQLGDLAVLELPTDRPRAALQSGRGGSEGQLVPASLVQALRELSLKEGCTLFMTLLAAFQTLLYRYSGQEDIAVGSPIANRTRSDTEGLIGFFVNTLVLRADLSGAPSFRQLLGRVREMTLEAYGHQDLPFEKLVEELEPERDLSHTPLFQVMLVLQNAAEGEFELAGLQVTPVEVETQSAMFDLTLSLEEGTDGLWAEWEYNADLFDAATIARATGHFHSLLEGIARNPDQAIATLPLLTASERQQMLVEWNQTQADYPSELCIHQLFEAQVERTPEAAAVVLGEEHLSYDALNRRANQLAHHLRKLGVGPDVPVGICVERSFEMVIGVLGILKAGGAYVPLDPGYPRERLAYMLGDARVPVLLTQARLRERLPGEATRILCLDAHWPQIAAEQETNPPPLARPDNLIYVIYTSGSTGSPKGAMISHRAVADRLAWMQRSYAVTHKDRLLQRAPFAFDVSAWELFLPLVTGAQLVLARPHDVEPSYLVTAIREHGITIICFVPSVLQVFLDEPSLESCHSLRLVICGAEPLSVQVANRLFSRLDAELHNLYGPTEACFHVTAWQCQRNDRRSAVPIGKPMANVRVHIVDTQLQPVPIGVAGELLIGGTGLARGYIGRPELTQEKFIADPFSAESGGRLYKTGDLARYLPDGNIEFLGRIDHQVKIRGFRIEPGEIEATLRRHPAVRDAIVLAREEAPGDKRLLAYVVAREGILEAGELRSFLKDTLPDYMVPSHFVLLAALPLTPNGKVDRAALAAIGPQPAPPGSAFLAPRNEVERVVAAAWSEVLRLERVGVHDNFFELGGHSLLATRLVSRLRDALHIDLPLRAIFEKPTVAQLAESLLQRHSTPDRV